MAHQEPQVLVVSMHSLLNPALDVFGRMSQLASFICLLEHLHKTSHANSVVTRPAEPVIIGVAISFPAWAGDHTSWRGALSITSIRAKSRQEVVEGNRVVR